MPRFGYDWLLKNPFQLIIYESCHSKCIWYRNNSKITHDVSNGSSCLDLLKLHIAETIIILRTRGTAILWLRRMILQTPWTHFQYTNQEKNTNVTFLEAVASFINIWKHEDRFQHKQSKWRTKLRPIFRFQSHLHFTHYHFRNTREWINSNKE
jgi:hypothetical protein